MNLQTLFEIFPPGELPSLLGSSYEADVEAVSQDNDRTIVIKDLAKNLFSSSRKDEAIPQVVMILNRQQSHFEECAKLKSELIQYAEENGTDIGLSPRHIKLIQSMRSAEGERSCSDESQLLSVHKVETSSRATDPFGVEDPPLDPSQPCVGQGSFQDESNTLLTPLEDDGGLMEVGELPPNVEELQLGFPPPIPVEYDKFPEEWCSFEELSERADILQQDYAKAMNIIDQIDERVKRDPAITSLSQNEYQIPGCLDRTYFPYDLYRAGRDIPGASIYGSDIHTDLQYFLLFGCPYTLQEASDLFDIILHQGIRVIVSLHQHDEPAGKMNDFFEDQRLISCKLRDGWLIRKISEKILDEDPLFQEGTCMPRIVESILLASKGVEQIRLRHFHYDGWQDGHPAPSESFLDELYRNIEPLLSPKTPIAINCIGGVGRSGTFALGLYNRRYIDQCMKGLERKINIPENLYREFRRRRAGVIRDPRQLAQVYSITAKYYQQVCARPKVKKHCTVV